MHLGFGLEFGKIEVFAPRSWPVAWEDAGVGTCGLSIKLDSQGMDGEGDVGVQETLHVEHACEQGRLGEVFVFCE